MSFAKFFGDLQCTSTALTTQYKKALTYKCPTTTPRELRLRASSLPTCSLLLLDKMLNHEVDTDEAMMDYYCSVGTTIHTHLQKWLGKTGKIFGNWRCPQCGHTHTDSVLWQCAKCKAAMEYQELEVALDIFSGHIDGVLQLESGKFMVYDFKSSSTKVLYAKKYVPVPKHLMQLAAYAVLLRLRGLDVDSLSILYIARDCPTTIVEYNLECTPELERYTLAFLKRQILGFKAAQRSVHTCTINTAVKYKMCAQYHDYKEEMEKFFFDGCPLAQYCFKPQRLQEYFTAAMSDE